MEGERPREPLADLAHAASTYRVLLARRRAAHRAARAAAAILLWLTAAAILLVGLLAADYALAFEPARLAGVGRSALIWLGVTLSWLLVRAGGITSRRLAAEIDAHLGDRRQPCLSALDLAATEPHGDVAALLPTRAVETASERLRALPATATHLRGLASDLGVLCSPGLRSDRLGQPPGQALVSVGVLERPDLDDDDPVDEAGEQLRRGGGR